MQRYTIEYRNSSKINLRKSTKQKIESMKKELKMEDIPEREFDKDSQIEIFCYYQRYFKENTNFSYVNFKNAIEERNFIPPNQLFGTAITYRKAELQLERDFYDKVRKPLNKERTAMLRKVDNLAKDCLYDAVSNRYPEDLIARCLVYVDDIIKEIESNTKPGMTFCNSKISIANAELANLANFEDDERYNRQISLKDYIALKKADEEERRLNEEARKRDTE